MVRIHLRNGLPPATSTNMLGYLNFYHAHIHGLAAEQLSAGMAMFHCHILEHEDIGMMGMWHIMGMDGGGMGM